MKQFPTLLKVPDSPHTEILFISSNSGKISLPLNTGTVIEQFISHVIDTPRNPFKIDFKDRKNNDLGKFSVKKMIQLFRLYPLNHIGMSFIRVHR